MREEGPSVAEEIEWFAGIDWASQSHQVCLVDARGQRLTPSHAVKKCRRYRYYVSAALITEAGTDRARRPPSCCASC